MYSSDIGAGGGRSSLEAWCTTALDIEECLGGAVDSDVHIFLLLMKWCLVTLDRGILDHVLGSLGLPCWFRRMYFKYHARISLADGLGESSTRDGGILQGCSVSRMVCSFLALYVLWCRYLDRNQLSCHDAAMPNPAQRSAAQTKPRPPHPTPHHFIPHTRTRTRTHTSPAACY